MCVCVKDCVFDLMCVCVCVRERERERERELIFVSQCHQIVKMRHLKIHHFIALL